MLQLAAQTCDGVVLMGAADPDFCAWQLEFIHQGLAAAGRDRSELTVDLFVTSVALAGDRGTCVGRIGELWQLDIDRITFALLSGGREQRLAQLAHDGFDVVVNNAGWSKIEPVAEMSAEHGAAYSAAKAGVLALTRVAAAENGVHGIRVNAIAPGLIYNDFLRRIYPEEFFTNYLAEKAFLGRIGQPDDVAAMVSLLASEESSYITGEVLTVSGGVSVRG